MCLIVFSYNMHSEYRLILAANRDEFYERPTLPLNYWKDCPRVLAGRDLKSRGTWLGITRSGRFSALTNYRDPAAVMNHAPSRGLLVGDFLTGSQAAESYIQQVKSIGHRYNGFNLLAGDADDFYYYSNKSNEIIKICPGLYGLSNHVLDTPWPKVRKAKSALEALAAEKRRIDPELIFNFLADDTTPPDDLLPNTGIGLEFERILSSVFIQSPDYGTRSSSVLLIHRNHRVTFMERTFFPRGSVAAMPRTVAYDFTL
jgi:uncharacterized protein with NRDE domain